MARPAALSSYLDFSAVIDWTVSWDFKSNKVSLKLPFFGGGGGVRVFYDSHRNEIRTQR